MTGVLIKRENSGCSERHEYREQHVKKGVMLPQAKLLAEARRGHNAESSLEPPKGVWPSPHFDFRL